MKYFKARPIFADKVLLVEGPSEMVLFGKVLSEKNPFYEADGIYILSVGGFGFKPYQSILNALKIYNVVKTDNDLRKPRNKETYSVLGFIRLNGLIGETILPEDPVNEKSVEVKRKLYGDEGSDFKVPTSTYSFSLKESDTFVFSSLL